MFSETLSGMIPDYACYSFVSEVRNEVEFEPDEADLVSGKEIE